MLKSVLVAALVLVLAGCGQGEPGPMRSAVQPAPSPSNALCYQYKDPAPVPQACYDQGEHCRAEDGFDGMERQCWWVDPGTGLIWYRPGHGKHR